VSFSEANGERNGYENAGEKGEKGRDRVKDRIRGRVSDRDFMDESIIGQVTLTLTLNPNHYPKP
jgi:hypothetical protein